MPAAPDSRTALPVGRELPPVSRLLITSFLAGILGMITAAFLLIQITIEMTGLINAGEAQPFATALGALVAVPVFAFVSFIIACFGGALVALFDRRFSFRRFYILTASAVALSLLLTAGGTNVVILWHVAPPVIVAVTSILNILGAAIYGRLLHHFAGVSKGGAIAVVIVWSLYLLSVGAWGIING